MYATTFGKGATLTWNSAAVALLTSVGTPELSIDSIDVTTHDSTGRAREFISGLYDAGEIAIEGYFDYTDTTGQHAMLTDAKAGTERSFTITGPSSVFTFTCSGFITKIKLVGDAPIDDKLAFTASIKVTGEPVFSVTSSNNLSNLVLTTATLYPGFAAATYDYTATSTGASVTVTPTASAGTITVNGATVNSGDASNSISLGDSGDMTTITIIVTESGKAPKTYTVRVAKTA